MRNLNKLRQAVDSPTGKWQWKLDGLLYPKETFLQLKHIQRTFLTLLSTICLKIHQITFVIIETMRHFPQHDSSVSF